MAIIKVYFRWAKCDHGLRQVTKFHVFNFCGNFLRDLFREFLETRKIIDNEVLCVYYNVIFLFVDSIKFVLYCVPNNYWNVMCKNGKPLV